MVKKKYRGEVNGGPHPERAPFAATGQRLALWILRAVSIPFVLERMPSDEISFAMLHLLRDRPEQVPTKNPEAGHVGARVASCRLLVASFAGSYKEHHMADTAEVWRIFTIPDGKSSMESVQVQLPNGRSPTFAGSGVQIVSMQP